MQRAVMSLIVFAGVALGVSACGGDDSDSGSSADKGKPIVIGAAMAKSGVMAQYDAPSYAAFKLRVDEINAKGGIKGRKIKLIEADTNSVPAKGKTAAQQVLDQGADIVLATADFDFGSPAALTAQRAGKVSFSLAAQSPKWGVQGIGPLSYTNTLATYSEGTVLARFAKQKKFKNPFLLIDDTISYDKEVCAGFEKEWGGPIAGKATFSTGDSSIAAQITKIKSANPGFIVSCTYVPGGGVALRQIRAAGIDQPIVADLAMDGTNWTKAVPKMGEYYVDSPVSVFGDDPNPKVNEVVKAFEKKTGNPPPVGLALTGYGTMEALEEALNKTDGDTDGTKLAAELDKLKGFETVTGETTFTPELHINTKRKMAILEYVNNKPKYVTSIESNPKVPLSGAR